MKQFQINREKIESMKRHFWIRLPLILILATIFELVLKIYNQDSFFVHQLAIMTVVIGLLHVRQLKKEIEVLRYYKLIITDRSIISEGKGNYKREIAFKDVNQINRTKDGSFFIKGRENNDVIFVPSSIENYGSLEKNLYQIRPINNDNDRSWTPRMIKFLIIVPFIIMAFLVKNKIFASVAVIFLAIVLVAGILSLKKNRMIATEWKRIGIVGILAIIFLIIAIISQILK